MTDPARTFRELHQGPDLLRLPNAWDAGSARLVESLGAKAVATTSAGVAWAQGYPDGDVLPLANLAAVTRSIARVVAIPLTVDIEGGYADDAAGAGETAAAILDAGAVGINIEDGAAPPALLAAKIERIKQVAAGKGIDLLVNARLDVYLRGLAPPAERVAMVIERARQYRAAGADGIFVPGATEPAEIRELAGSVGLPLNIMAWPGLGDAVALQTLGVRRLSAGSGIAQALWGKAQALAQAFLADGVSAPLGEGAMAYPAINGLFGG